MKMGKTIKKGLGLVLVGAVLVGVVGWWLIMRAAPQDEPIVQSNVVTHSTDSPSTDKPSADYEWKGAPDDPQKIIIPSLGIDGYIQNIGIDQRSEIAVPENTHLAGWFVDSVRPGEKGLSIIDGHIDMRSGAPDAIFQHLDTIEKGAEVTIMFGDDTKQVFKVTELHDVSVEESAELLFSSSPKASHQLNLITCGGTYNPDTKQFDRRIVVYTERAS